MMGRWPGKPQYLVWTTDNLLSDIRSDMTRIPVWKTSLASVAVIVAHAGAWFRLSALVLGIVTFYLVGSSFAMLDTINTMVERFPELIEATEAAEQGRLTEEQLMAEFQDIQGSSNLATALNMLGFVIMLGGLAMLLVRWCRFAALGDDAGGRWMLLRFGSLELEMLGAIVILGLLFWFGFFIAFLLSTLLVAAVGPAGYAVMCVVFVALFVVVLRLCLLIPQVACDGGLNLAETWRRTRGNTWRIFAASLNVGVAALFVYLLALLITGGLAYLFFVPGDLFESGREPVQIILDLVPFWFVLMNVGNIFFFVVHVVFVAMLALIHAQLTAHPADAFD